MEQQHGGEGSGAVRGEQDAAGAGAAGERDGHQLARVAVPFGSGNVHGVVGQGGFGGDEERLLHRGPGRPAPARGVADG